MLIIDTTGIVKQSMLKISGLPEGKYRIKQGRQDQTVESTGGIVEFKVPIDKERIQIQRVSA
jgi:hypothetical protein